MYFDGNKRMNGIRAVCQDLYGQVIALGWVLMLLLVGEASGQQAVVLGGGGSRGLAHAGVLAGLEELGYEPELVVGTSMGAIIGSLYAAGHSPDEVWRIVLAQDWPELFVHMPRPVGPRRELRYPQLEVGIGVERPAGLVAEWRINRALVHLLFDAGARSGGDFDRLPRRFRSVAADLRTGEAVVIAEGDLARAVRASMAVPGVFAAVVRGGAPLVDGGIANYLPISVARAAGARYVVASDVIRPAPEIEDRSALAAGLRGLRLTLRNTLPDTVADVLVLPEIPPQISEALFPRDPTPLFRAGMEAARRDAAGRPPASGGSPPRAPLPQPDSLVVLRIETSDPGVAALARRLFRDVAPARYDTARVLRAVDRLYETGLVEGVWPRVERVTAADEGARGAGELVVRVDPVARTDVVGAAGYDNDRGGRVWAGASMRAGGAVPFVLGLTGSFGSLEQWAAASVRVHPRATAPLVWSAGAHHTSSDVRVRGGELDVRRTGGWLGAEMLRVRPSLALAAIATAEHIERDDGEDGASYGPLLRIEGVQPLTRLVGAAPLLELEARAGDVSYQRVRARAAAHTERGHWSLAALVDVTSASSDAPADVLPALGDEWLLPGMRWGEERGSTRVVAGADVAHPIVLEGALRLRLRAGAAAGDVDAFRESGAWALGAALELLWATPLGPIMGGVGTNTRGQWRVEVNVGPWF